jgi:hypothetical protein
MIMQALKAKFKGNLNHEILVIFLISFCFAIFTNSANIYVTNLMYGSEADILYGSTLGSPDNAWYLNQIKNYLNGFGFTIDPLDPIYAVRRTPGYPIFYGLHFMFFGEAWAHKIIPYTQTFLHAFAAVYLFKTAKLIFSNSRVAYWSGVLYGLSPFVVSFLFMTITESLFPAIIIFSLYLAVSSYVSTSVPISIFAGIMIAVAVLIRPMAGLTLLFLIPLAFYFKKISKGQLIKNNAILILAFVITMTPWGLRNYLVFKEFVPLETYYLSPMYEGQNIKNVALARWWMTWGNPDHVSLHNAINADINTDKPYKTIDDFIDNHVVYWIYNVQSKEQLRNLLIDYQRCMSKEIDLNGGRRLRYMESPDLCEYKISDRFNFFTEKIKSQYPFEVYLKTPLLKRGISYIFHSAIHTWRSLDDYKSHEAKIVIKCFAYLVNIALWLFSIAYLISPRDANEKFLLGIVPLASFIFVIFYLHVEGRYLLAIYPFLYLMSVVFIFEVLIPILKKYSLRLKN